MNWRRMWTETAAGGIIGGFSFAFGIVLFASLVALIVNLVHVIGDAL